MIEKTLLQPHPLLRHPPPGSVAVTISSGGGGNRLRASNQSECRFYPRARTPGPNSRRRRLSLPLIGFAAEEGPVWIGGRRRGGGPSRIPSDQLLRPSRRGRQFPEPSCGEAGGGRGRFVAGVGPVPGRQARESWRFPRKASDGGGLRNSRRLEAEPGTLGELSFFWTVPTWIWEAAAGSPTMITPWSFSLLMRTLQPGSPLTRIYHSDYNNELTQFLPRTIILKKPSGAQLGFNIRGGKASQLGIFISKVIPDSDAHRAGLQEGDQVLAVNDVDFQDIEHSKAVEILKTAREIIMRVRFFPYNYHRQKERTVH